MEFVDWEATAASTGFDWHASLDRTEHVTGSNSTLPPEAPIDPSLDLVLGDINVDGLSYLALQHYESPQAQRDHHLPTNLDEDPQVGAPVTPQFPWETPEDRCTNCSRWGYQCKRIRQGKYSGYCTGCVVLQRNCSLGLLAKNHASEGGVVLPANSSPIVGDRPETSIVNHEDEIAAIISSKPQAPLAVAVGEMPLPPQPQLPPKNGVRFSRESVKVLKNWIATHKHHPYPIDEERERLQRITGLNKTQITNWLANARRRGKIQLNRATSPNVGRAYSQGIDIPPRERGAPGLVEDMNPLQRWENSPPENEPASAIAIARAVSASDSYPATTGVDPTSPNIWNISDDSSRSLCNQSSTSSFVTSHSSGGSFASVGSNRSLSSSIPSFVRSNRGRRRRRRVLHKPAGDQLNQPPKTFQCTFCTESFRTKHDWQRHEKSLHLSLERWICSPDGPRTIQPDNGQMSCNFCGEANPDDAHIEAHNFSSCIEHTKEERTFYRKDHLRQHLRLVHEVSFLPWSMEKWRRESPAIRSRCGFCGVVLHSWPTRVDHLAEHFKLGSTMADWKGDWGFDASILELIENSIPPYLIHDERQSPLPFRASQPASGSPTNAYDLLKIELQWWLANKSDELGIVTSDLDIQREACRILYGAQVMPRRVVVASASWLCDLVMSSETAKRQAAFRPRAPGSNCLSSLRINGKSNIFEGCLLEKDLQDYVRAKLLLGLTAMDYELQDEACRILGRIEERSNNPDEQLVNWFIRTIRSSSSWLEDFRRRAGLPRGEDVGDPQQRSAHPTTIYPTIHNYSRLEVELADYFRQQRSLGHEPTDSDLQRQARFILYEVADQWDQTAAEDKDWLRRFKERYMSEPSFSNHAPGVSPSSGGHSSPAVHSSPAKTPDNIKVPSKSPAGSSVGLKHPRARFLNDAKCYRRMAEDLSRYVAAAMSLHNPNRHVPTDEELKHQARWIVYDDDDPFNRTAANNVEWLQRFKVDAGLLPPETGPGLGSWGGFNYADYAGYEPPYVYRETAGMIEPLHGTQLIYVDDYAAEPIEPVASTAKDLVQNITQKSPAPNKIFCSRELERGLTEYVKREMHRSGVFPSDTQLQERAREILNVQRTPCENSFILGKFKAYLQESMSVQQQHFSSGGGSDIDFGALPASAPTTSAIPAALACMPPPDPALSSPAADIRFPDIEFLT